MLLALIGPGCGSALAAGHTPAASHNGGPGGGHGAGGGVHGVAAGGSLPFTGANLALYAGVGVAVAGVRTTRPPQCRHLLGSVELASRAAAGSPAPVTPRSVTWPSGSLRTPCGRAGTQLAEELGRARAADCTLIWSATAALRTIE